MGAHKSIQAGKAKLDIGVNLIRELCCSYDTVPVPPFADNFLFMSNSTSVSPLSMAIGRCCIKHPNLFGRNEMLDVSWHKGLHDSNLLIAYRKPLPHYLGQPCITIQHSVAPEVGIHGIPMHKFSHSASGGVRSSKLSIAFHNMDESSSTSNWSKTTSVNFKHIRFRNNDGRYVNTDLYGFPLTFSGNPFDNMLVIKQESKFEQATDKRFSYFSLQMEQGVTIHSNLVTFSRLKFVASRGLKLGPAFFSTWLTGGSIVGAMAPYLAFAIGGPDSVRGYGEGAIGSGQSCLISKNELEIPLNKKLEGFVFLDCGSNLRSGHRVPGNPGRRQGKPESGCGTGCGIRLKSKLAQININFAINAFQQRTLYFGINNIFL